MSAGPGTTGTSQYVRDCVIDTCHLQDAYLDAYVVSCINGLDGHVCLTKPEVMLVVEEKTKQLVDP